MYTRGRTNVYALLVQKTTDLLRRDQPKTPEKRLKTGKNSTFAGPSHSAKSVQFTT